MRALTEEVGTVLLIGHNEGIGELAESLAGSGRAADLAALRAKYPTGTLATLRAPAIRWSELTLRSAELCPSSARVICYGSKDGPRAGRSRSGKS